MITIMVYRVSLITQKTLFKTLKNRKSVFLQANTETQSINNSIYGLNLTSGSLLKVTSLL